MANQLDQIAQFSLNFGSPTNESNSPCSASVRLGNSFKVPFCVSVKELKSDHNVRALNSSCCGPRHSFKIAGIWRGVQAPTSVERIMRSCAERSVTFLFL